MEPLPRITVSKGFSRLLFSLSLAFFLSIVGSTLGFDFYLTTKNKSDARNVALVLGSIEKAKREKVVAKKTEKANFIQPKKIPEPTISALSYLVADLKTGEVFLEKNETKKFPIASLTKLMTAIVSYETIKSDSKITIDADALQTIGDSGQLGLGEVLSANDILYPLLMESSNDAAQALALHVGEKKFVTLMNKKAKSIGMNDTGFEDASGIGSENASTVRDLFALTEYLKTDKPFLLNITHLPKKHLSTNTRNHDFRNFNIFSEDPRFLGGKTGYTKAARETMIALFEMPVGPEKRNIAFIVLNSSNREKDIRALKQWFEKASKEAKISFAKNS